MSTSEARAALTYEFLPLVKELRDLVIGYLGVFKRELVRRCIALYNVQDIDLLADGRLVAVSHCGLARVVGESPFRHGSNLLSVTSLAGDSLLLCTHHHMEVWNPRLFAVRAMSSCPSAVVATQGGWVTAIKNDLDFWRLGGRTIRHLDRKTLKNNVTALAYKADTSQLVVAEQTVIHVVTAVLGAYWGHSFELKGHAGKVFKLVDMPENQLASACTQNKCMVWDLLSRNCVLVIDLAETIRCFPHVDGCLVFGFSERDCPAQAWDVSTGALVAKFGTHSHAIISLIVLPNGQLVATALDGGMTFWK